MHWDAPIAISVFRNKRGKRRVAFCFSIYIVGGNLHIKQIQGIFGTDIPSELRAWPKIFIETCRTFACQETLREVRVARADSLYSYHTPSLRRDLLPDARQRSLERIRKNMTLGSGSSGQIQVWPGSGQNMTGRAPDLGPDAIALDDDPSNY
jgi:hypothetical protein